MGNPTPGPWRYAPWHIEEGNPTVRAPEGWLICETSSDANARLIAAAPDLLEALIDARKQLEAYEEALNGEDYNSPRINEAIAKATGGEQ